MNRDLDARAPSSGMEQISVRIPDAVRLTGLSRSKIYQLIAYGDLEVAKVGRSTVIIASSLREFIAARRTRRSLPSQRTCNSHPASL